MLMGEMFRVDGMLSVADQVIGDADRLSGYWRLFDRKKKKGGGTGCVEDRLVSVLGECPFHLHPLPCIELPLTCIFKRFKG